jgi:murein DD-endopeptidase MepM/ murein hydrolase activator NlpD
VFGLDRDAPAIAALEIHYANGGTATRKLQIARREYHIERVEGLPQKTVTPDPETAARIEREQTAVAQARQRDDEREDFLRGFSLPVEGARISGVYGSQRIDNGTPKAPHMGLDLAVPEGTPIHAPAAGVVTFAQPDLVLTGGTVLIDHGFGASSSFLHMSRLDVKVGDRVERGTIIGAAGMTGRATGPHVHWGFNWFDVRVDPALLPKPTR